MFENVWTGLRAVTTRSFFPSRRSDDFKQPVAAKVSCQPPAPIAGQPFAELVLNERKANKTARRIKHKGYATIAMAPATKDFLTTQNAAASDWRIGHYANPEKDFIGSQIERQVTGSAMRVAVSLDPTIGAPLVPQEFQLRHFTKEGADRWHIDKADKKIVLLATL